MKTKWYLKTTTQNMLPPITTSRFKFEVGKWTPYHKPVLCHSGWHVSDMQHINEFGGYSRRLFVCIADGKHDQTYNKSVHARIKLLFEIDRDEFDTYFRRAYVKKVKATGLFTPTAIKLMFTRTDVIRSVREVCGLAPSDTVTSNLSTDIKFRAHFKRYVERKLRALGYD